LSSYGYEIYDYYMTSTLSSTSTSGIYLNINWTSEDTYSTRNGKQDWVIREDVSLTSCEASYCNFTCSVYRDLDTGDEYDIAL